jgi:hypothetical protein
LNFGILQPRLLKTRRMGETVNVNEVDQLIN